MNVRLLSASSVATAMLALATPVHAGVVFGQVNRMEGGAGLIDLDFSVPDPFLDIATINTPAIGSYLLVEATVPDISAYTSGLEFTTVSGADAVFSFSNGRQLTPWHLGEYEFAFAANRLAFTSTYGVIVTLRGNLSTVGTGYGFFDVGGDVQDIITFGSSPVEFETTLGAGSQVISWGSIVGNAGGSAMFTGTLTLTLVPGPGSLALFAASGLVARRRRRV